MARTKKSTDSSFGMPLGISTPNPSLRTAIAEFNQGGFREAARGFSRLIASDRRDCVGLLFRGLAYRALGKTAAAFRDLHDVAAWRARDPKSYILRALGRHVLGRYEQAARDLDHAAALDKDPIAVRLEAAEMLRRLGYSEACLAQLERAAMLDPASASIHARRAEACLLAGFPEKARKALAPAIALNSRIPRDVLQIAEMFRKLGDYRACLDQVRRALALGAQSAEAHFLRAEACLGLGRTGAAGLSVRLSLRHGPASTQTRRRASDLYCRIAAALIERRAYAAALGVIGRALRCDPDHGPLLALSARLRLWRGEYDHAFRDAGRALMNDPDNAAALRERGAVHVLRGAPVRAMRDLRRATALNPSDSEAHIWKAELMLRMGRYHQALRACEIALRGSRAVAVRLIRGLVLLRLGDPAWRIEWDQIAPVLMRRVRLPASSGLHPRRARRVLEGVLRRLRGSRCQPATFAPRVDGRVRLVVATLPARGFRLRLRVEALGAQKLMRERGLEAALEAFDVLLKSPLSRVSRALVYCHRGEAFLWAGRLSEASIDFERAVGLHSRTKWAYVCLCAVRTLQGRWNVALRLADKALHYGAHSVLVWRGEALRRAGRLPEAVADLERTLSAYPHRLGAVINLALAKGDMGKLEEQRSLCRRVSRSAPSLFAEAGREIHGRPVEYSSRCGGRERLLLEKALELLRGNRSSWMDIFHTSNGAVRTYL